MKRNLFEMDETEKSRILEMHQTATSKQYLTEQSQTLTKLKDISSINTFFKGQYDKKIQQPSVSIGDYMFIVNSSSDFGQQGSYDVVIKKAIGTTIGKGGAFIVPVTYGNSSFIRTSNTLTETELTPSTDWKSTTDVTKSEDLPKVVNEAWNTIPINTIKTHLNIRLPQLKPYIDLIKKRPDLEMLSKNLNGNAKEVLNFILKS
jgi:hypothetical protein